MNSVIELDCVSKNYTLGEIEVPALKCVNLNVKRGDFVAIVGASGSGKSTMMNLIGCLDLPTSGKITLDGKNISELSESNLASLRGKTIGFVFQQYNLVQSMTALENVMLPLEFLEYSDEVARKRAEEILSLVGLKEKMYNRPNQLSGGQQQRVSIARSLAANPEVILADEPTGALDSKTGREILELISKLWKEEGKTIVMVTHDVNVTKYARTIVELKDGQIVRVEKN